MPQQQLQLKNRIDLSTLVIDPGGQLSKEWVAGQPLTVVRDDDPRASECIYFLGYVHANEHVAERFHLCTTIDYNDYILVEYYSWIIVVHKSHLESL